MLDRSLSSSRVIRWAVATALPLLACGRPARAQTPQPTPAEIARQGVALQIPSLPEAAKVRERRQETRVVYPYGLSGTALNGASVLASRDAKRVAIAATFSTSLLSELVVNASAPLSEDEPRSAVLQLDGLANKSKVGVEWRYGQQRLPSREAMATLTSELAAICLATNPTPEKPAVDTGLVLQGCSIAELRKKSPAAAAAIDTYFPRRAAWYVSLKGDVGPETFKFSDATTFASTDERKWSGSGAVVVGFLTPQNLYVAGSVRFDRTYEAAKSQALCTIGALDQITACPNKIVGGPAEKTLKVTEVELRKYLPPIAGLTFGVAGIVRRDWKQDDTTVEVPLYFLKDKEGGLSGGVSGGYVWSSDKDTKGARFTVFVGQTFGLGG